MSNQSEAAVLDLEAWFAEVETALRDAETEVNRLRAERKAIVAEAHGVAEGSIVIARGKRYIVNFVNWHYGTLANKPYLKGRAIKKDGSPGSVVQSLGSNWELESA